MTKPRVLDLFCGAGGAGEGYRRVGFEVMGVDIEHHNYPCGTFEQADAMDVLRAVVASEHNVDVIHLSPPCQRWSTSTANQDKHPDYIAPMRPLLKEWVAGGGVYVIENVPRAPLVDPIRLCGSSFGLMVRRHRMFESNVSLDTLPCDHKAQGTPVGVYGDHPDSREFLRPDGTRRGAKARTLEEGQRAMGIDWMTWKDLTEAIPPAYTEYIGRQIMEKVFA